MLRTAPRALGRGAGAGRRRIGAAATAARTGTATGAGKDPLKLENMMRNEDIQDGDLIVTSGTDSIYPPGLVVGRVANIEKKEHGMFQRADILPAVDVTRLEEVLVVGSQFQDTLIQTEGTR